MKIDEVFSINGRGTLVTGVIENGPVYTGDKVYISGMGKSLTSVVTGIEMSRMIYDSAEEGEICGLLLRDVDKDDLDSGMVIYSKNASSTTKCSKSSHSIISRSSASTQASSNLHDHHFGTHRVNIEKCSSFGRSKMISEKVMAIIGETLLMDLGNAYLTDNLDDLGADSLDAADIIMKLEKEFNISISKGELERMRTIQDIVMYIENALGVIPSVTEYANDDEEDVIEKGEDIEYKEDEDNESSETSSDTTFNEERTYLYNVQGMLKEDGIITINNRQILEDMRSVLGISKQRADELESAIMLTENEKEYLDEYKVCLAEAGEISSGERRLLNRLRDKLGISKERASELENL